jgi:hypothetical protein
MEAAEPRTFEEFWLYYCSQHAHPWCRRLHFTGTALAMGCLLLSPLDPRLLVAAPVVGYGFSWVGHFVFERNRPASWHSAKHFVWSFMSDVRMVQRMLAGTMEREVARALAR